MNITVLHETWRAHPLAWIHRAEARSVAKELENAGHAVNCFRLREDAIASIPSGRILVRLSDPAMLSVIRQLSRSGKRFIGPNAAVMERCYDKYEACRFAATSGVDCPATVLASQAGSMPFPLVLKPRWGSDSIGVRLLTQEPLPKRALNDDHILQEQVRGSELTIAVFRDRVGMPLRIFLPEGTPYSFLRKYLLRPARAPLTDSALVERVRQTASKIAAIFAINWAARIDLIHETSTDRLCFLECDTAPLIGAQSAFSASFQASGMERTEQLDMLLS